MAEGLQSKFTFLGKITKTYVTFLAPIPKEVARIDKKWKKKKIIRSISTRLQPIDSSRFMTSSLSNLVNNLAEEIQKYKCKYMQIRYAKLS